MLLLHMFDAPSHHPHSHPPAPQTTHHPPPPTPLPQSRCEHRPSVCAEVRARRKYQKDSETAGGRLAANGPRMYASQAECCRPGLGSFSRGCSTTWF